MKVTKLIILLSCLLTALTSSAAKYQIKVLNTPTITIDNYEAKVGDWFSDESVIIWSRDNQAMRVVSDENKVYTLSAKLYKEAKAKKFADFILYTKPLAARGTNNLDLIEQLAERFDNTFVMIDEVHVDLSDIEIPKAAYIEFMFEPLKQSLKKLISHSNSHILIPRREIKHWIECGLPLVINVYLYNDVTEKSLVTDSFEIEVTPLILVHE